MIEIDPDSSVAPYEQVRAGLAARIGDGSLPVGTRLPTVRALAGELGLAVNTVARAYRELEAAGLVDTRGRSGTYVTAAGDRTRMRLAQAAAAYAARARSLGVRDDDAVDAVRAAVAALPPTRG